MPSILIIDHEEFNLLTTGIFAKLSDYRPALADKPSPCALSDPEVAQCPHESACTDALLIEQHQTSAMTGLELLQRQHDRGCKCPSRNKAIMAYALTEDEFFQSRHLDIDFLQKPITYERLSNWLAGSSRR